MRSLLEEVRFSISLFEVLILFTEVLKTKTQKGFNSVLTIHMETAQYIQASMTHTVINGHKNNNHL